MRNYLFTEFDNRVSMDVLHELNHMIDNNDDWMPTKKYLFDHMIVPEELVKKDPYLKFIYDRFGKVLPWVLCVRPIQNLCIIQINLKDVLLTFLLMVEKMP